VAIGSSEAAHDLNGAQARIKALPALAGQVSLLYLALYLHFGFFNLINLWLKETGSLPDEIALLTAIPLILRLITVAPFAAWCGRRGLVRNAIGTTALAAAMVIFTLPLATSHTSRIIVFLVFAIAWDQIPVLIEAYAVMAVRNRGLEYGRLRVWGSIGWIASGLIAGALVDRFGILSVPMLTAAFLLLTVTVAPFLPNDRQLVREPPQENGGWRELFSDRPLIAGMVAASLLMGSNGVLMSFGAIQWQGQGFSAFTIGVLNGIGVATEIVAFVFGARLLGKRDPRLLMAIAAGGQAIRFALMAATPGLPVLVLAQLLQSVGAAGALLAPILLIAGRVPSRLVPNAQGLFAVCLGATVALVVLGSGHLWGLGPAVAYLAMSVLALLALPVLAVWRHGTPISSDTAHQTVGDVDDREGVGMSADI
jgi:PPP family 3-phenylpropionic acid transporter